jgi:hypothetical protein
MDWLRSEDLKEEKVVTTSPFSVPRAGAICLFQMKRTKIATLAHLFLCEANGDKCKSTR